MPKEKKTVGRPRKYATTAERQKAYHERKKKRIKELEEELKKLEKQDSFSFVISEEFFDLIPFKEIGDFPEKHITPSEIALMGTQDLELLVENLERKIEVKPSLNATFENIILGVISKYHLKSLENTPESELEKITNALEDNFDHLKKSIQQQTLLYLLNAELANRMRLDDKKSRLDIFSDKVEELEKTAKKK
jgi:hypothetical protein